MRSKLTALLVPAVLALSALPTLAQNNGVTQDEEWHDARLEGYTGDNGTNGPIVIKPASGSAGTWFMTVILGAICLGVMCKDGKRTFLD